MGGIIAWRTASEMPGLDIAEQKAWQHILDAAPHVYAALNRSSLDQRKLTFAHLRLVEILHRSEVVGDAIATYAKGVWEHSLGPLSRPWTAAMGENSQRISAALRGGGSSTRFGRI